ncbi:Glycosyltransferase involved in cell wall bisynthesis [Sphingomonas guangdongensis]|uniref:Glycosyltransferase involved in cell wall bisynthesis n=1 Tax=Sphingomonas guangdongensis TaxID=1141890 RepID=A0A285QGZ8_9SPHN|nr:glycosyltransferase [Sphingomonas guangdongensis]SOB81116.1 Glycosyltransferase involved in cell wall bisynthesis [Sphingomonas guangdongensis]
MRILFASAHPYLPQLSGGTQANTHEMAERLIARGHEVAVLAGLTSCGWIGLRGRVLMKVGHGRSAVDTALGYRVYRAWFAWDGAADCVARFRPDVAVVQSGAILRVADALRTSGTPILIYNHNVDFDDHGSDICSFRDEIFIANSTYTAAAYEQGFGISSAVIVPLFDRARYVVEPRRREVLFVNPHPHKGVDIALRLATDCPHIPFRFVRGWPLSEGDAARLNQGVAACPNVRLFPKTDRMAQHYAEARVLLAPSRWKETWGRVATEAQFSGIPVLASNIGGLPEAVGPGGLLVEPDAPASAWRDALEQLWEDTELHDRLAAAALDHSRRAEIDPDRQIRALESMAERAIADRRRSP